MSKWPVRFFILGAVFGIASYTGETATGLSSLAEILFYVCVVAFLVTILTDWIRGPE